MAKTTKFGEDIHPEIERISEAAAEALKIVARETSEAAQKLALAAAEALKITAAKNSDDHDLIIEIRGQLIRVIADIKEIKDGTAGKINNLEQQKVDVIEFEKLNLFVHEKLDDRLKIVETKTSNYSLTLSLFTLAVVGLISLVVYHIVQIPI